MYYGPVPSYQFMTAAVTQSEWQCEIKDCVTIFLSLHAVFFFRTAGIEICIFFFFLMHPERWDHRAGDHCGSAGQSSTHQER